MGSFLFARIAGLENNIYLQTGVIMLIGLLAKTAILITEYAIERRRKGMGIGLSICKSIVMAHQGDVYARNYEDGAEFSFSLPMDEKELTEEKEL